MKSYIVDECGEPLGTAELECCTVGPVEYGVPGRDGTLHVRSRGYAGPLSELTERQRALLGVFQDDWAVRELNSGGTNPYRSLIELGRL